ncbi:MAG: ATP-binding protein [Candidatus Latescibacteria bacterium]|nr:ATP-binding protein [Candidatus Latescibacterota bacterium]MCK5380477.1 ATP-binding protein [Candidatus Latescibacterota bacterium]MCK5526505.1 ATP-binding protein [Candidatus Latescibacterota bacterium]
MKQLTLISGKGGTGKTTLVSAFAALAKEAILVDADVDAPDLHLVMRPEFVGQEDVGGGEVARIIEEKCTYCGQCETACVFRAVDEFWVSPLFCRGCAVCTLVCPSDAIEMLPKTLGQVLVGRTAYGPFVYPRMHIGESGTGRFITALRNKAREIGTRENKALTIIDGSPGIGCSLIASIGGVDAVLAVTEPTLSGMHDLERVLDVAAHFGISAQVCVNKFDIHERNTDRIEAFCRDRGVESVGRIPYDPEVSRSLAQGKHILESNRTGVIEAIEKVWRNVSDGLCRNGSR